MAAVDHSARFSPLPSLPGMADASSSIFDGFTGVLLVQERSDFYSRKCPSPASPSCVAVPFVSPDSHKQSPWSRTSGLSRNSSYSFDKTPVEGSKRGDTTESAGSGGLRMRRMSPDGGDVEIPKIRFESRTKIDRSLSSDTFSPTTLKLDSLVERSPTNSEALKAVLSRRSLKELHQL